MKRMLAVLMCAALCVGCSDKPAKDGGSPAVNGVTIQQGGTGKVPTFKLAWSEYPSWSVFGVASDKGLINGKAGAQGPLETKYGIDLELVLVDYDTCIQQYGSSVVDAVCMTNMDSLNPALGRPTTAILPTSTSDGADACVVVGIGNPDELKSHKVYGLEKSVSEYAFVRCLQKLGLNPDEYKMSNMPPDAAATALQQSDSKVKAIMVWNPFVLQTLRTNPSASVLFDSSKIGGEIIDMVCFANDSLSKPGGGAAASCICEAYYTTCKLLNDPATADETYVALGAKFSSLGAEDMRKCCTQTKFYDTPQKGLSVLTGSDTRTIMDTVVKFCVDRQIVPSAPSVGYNDTNARLNFSPQYINAMLSLNGEGPGGRKQDVPK